MLTGEGLNTKNWTGSKNPIRVAKNPGCRRREKTAPSLTETGCAPLAMMKTRGLAFMNRSRFVSLTKKSPVCGPTVMKLVRNGQQGPSCIRSRMLRMMHGPQGPSVLYSISRRNLDLSRCGMMIVRHNQQGLSAISDLSLLTKINGPMSANLR
jgi:hypothetical protein